MFVSAHSTVCAPQAIFQQVDFKQTNLSNPASCDRVFADDEGPFDLVYNLAAETKYGQSSEVSVTIVVM